MKDVRDEKTQKILDNCEKELAYAVDVYIANMKKDMDWNREVFESMSADWKKYAYRINSVQKLIYISPLAFNIKCSEKIKSIMK